MSTLTFENLPEEKRKRILYWCYREFSLHDYKSASLSRIVEKADIAKGSMYQYFGSKRELYFSLLDRAGTEKLQYLDEHIDFDQDFFMLLKTMVTEGARFNLNNPLKAGLLYNAVRENPDGEPGGVGNQLRARSKDFFHEILSQAVKNGKVRRDIDIDFIAFSLNQLFLDLEDYLGERFGFSYGEVLRSREDKLPPSDADIGRVVDELVRFVRNGLEP